MPRILYALACLTLAACVYSPVPITAGGPPQTDAKLIGTWRFTMEDEPQELTISRDAAAAPGDDLLVVLPYTEGETHKLWRLRVVIAHLAGRHYASLSDIDTTEPAPAAHRFSLTRYEFTGPDRFVLHAPTEWLDDAVDKKLIAGHQVQDRHMYSVELGASSEELSAFMRAHGAKSFFSKEPLVFERVK